MSFIAAMGITGAVLFYAGMLYLKPEYDSCKLKGLALACAVAMAVGAVRMAVQTYYYESMFADKVGNVVSASDSNAVKASDSNAVNDSEKKQAKQKIKAEVLKVSLKKDKNPKLTVRISRPGSINRSGRKCLLTYYGAGGSSSGQQNNNERKLRQMTGSLIEFRGDLEEAETAGNPRCFDYRSYLRSQGISCVSSTGSIRIVKQNASIQGLIRRKILKFKDDFITALCGSAVGANADAAQSETNQSETNQSEENQAEALLRGILFGDTDSMDEDMKDDFRRNGTAHILAVSGLHIGLLYSIFRLLRKKAAIPGITAAFLLILGIYGTMTLWAVSVTRAVALILIMELGEKLDRPYDLLTSLGFVSMLVLMNEPYALYGTSFIMSYLAALSIGVIVPVVKRIVPDKIPDGIKTSLAVQIGLVPFVAYTFNMLPLGALIINIPVIFLLTIMVSVSAAAVPVYMALSALSFGYSSFFRALPVAGEEKLLLAPFSKLLMVLSDLMVSINSRFTGFDLLSPDVVSPPLFVVAAYYGILFLLCSESFRVARLRKRIDMAAPQIVVTVIMILISCVLSVSPFDKADIVMVDVGQGDCMHFRFKPDSIVQSVINDKTDVIIDGGGNEKYNVGKKTLKPYLLKNGVRKVDLALATHLHTDHYKGIQELEKENLIRQTIIEGKTGDTIYVTRQSKRRQDKEQDRIEIIWPDNRDPDTDDENKNSLIFKVYINGITVLITGDLGEEGEHALVERYRGTDVLDCDVLKVCHHGSKYSSTAEFIEAVSPVVALIGVGKKNTYGHPSSEAIERLENAGAIVFRTDTDGAIGIRNVKKRLKICKMNN